MIQNLFDFLDRNAWAPWLGILLCILVVGLIEGSTFPYGLM